MNPDAQAPAGRHRLIRELKEYAIISVYLYVCFGAILFYKAAVLGAHGPSYVHYGTAAAKALVLAKFMLIGHAIRLGERYRHMPLIYVILYESVIFLVWLVALSVVEEAVVGVIHGRTAVQSISEIAGGTWLQIVATCALLWLILLPYFGFRQVSDVLCEGKLPQILFGKR